MLLRAIIPHVDIESKGHILSSTTIIDDDKDFNCETFRTINQRDNFCKERSSLALSGINGMQSNVEASTAYGRLSKRLWNDHGIQYNNTIQN